MASSVYTYIGNSNAANKTASLTVASGTVALNASGLFASAEVSSLVGQGFLLVPGPASSPFQLLTAPAVTAGATGVVNGVYFYAWTFVTANGETIIGPESSITVSNKQVSLTNAPVAPAQWGVVARRLYRTSAGGASGTEKLVTTINDNVTTTYTDNTADGSLGAAAPVKDTSSVIPPTNALPGASLAIGEFVQGATPLSVATYDSNGNLAVGPLLTALALANGVQALPTVTTTDPLVTSDVTQGFVPGSQWINSSTATLYICLSNGTGAAVWQRTTANVQVFLSSGTWTKPAWAQKVDVVVVGGAGGAGSGIGNVSSGTACSGGAPGAGAGISRGTFAASALGATESVTVGAGGAGGHGSTTTGIAGSSGGATLFGAHLVAGYGNGGAGGATTTVYGGQSSAQGQFMGYPPNGQPVANNVGANGSSGGNGSNYIPANGGGPSGGGGGGISTAPAAFSGGPGINPLQSSINYPGTGGAPGTAGGNGTSVTYTNEAGLGSSGAGGGSSITNSIGGGSGGNGGNYGAGGGGGGSVLSTNTVGSGAGGNGSQGICVVITS